MAVSVGLIGYSCLVGYNQHHEYKTTQIVYAEINEEAVIKQPELTKELKTTISVNELDVLITHDINFDMLLEQNHETIGWISIEQLEIEFPIVQTANNVFYLKHTFDRTENKYGTIMLNCDNKATFTDQNSIIYGHTFEDDSMFGPLKDYLDIQDELEHFYIYTPHETIEYEIIAVAQVEKTHDIYQVKFKDGDFLRCMEDIKDKASYYNYSKDTEEEIVTLSTCSDNGNKRLVVIAKRFVKE